MLLLLAQLVAPPIQPGPARIPERQSPAASDDAIQLEVKDKKKNKMKATSTSKRWTIRRI